MNRASINIEQVSLWQSESSFGYMPKSGGKKEEEEEKKRNKPKQLGMVSYVIIRTVED